MRVALHVFQLRYALSKSVYSARGRKKIARKMTPVTMTMGKGAVVSVLSCMLHPSEHTKAVFLIVQKNHGLENAVVIRQQPVKINRKDQLALILTHFDFAHDGEHIELYAEKSYCLLIAQGDPDYFFEFGPMENLVVAGEDEILPEEISVFRAPWYH
jgi:hypothetical protein